MSAWPVLRQFVTKLVLVLTLLHLTTSSAARQLEQEDEGQDINTWIAAVPHTPVLAWRDALAEHAFTMPGNKQAIILSAGNAHSFDTTMPRMLQALSGVQPDLSKHVIITAIGGLAWRLCGSVMNNGAHEGHCALDKYLKAPDGPVSWGTNWHTAFQLLKLETVLNVATLGYSALWIEPHALIAGNPLPHLLGLGVDVAFPALHCATAPSMPALAASDAPLDLSTELVWAEDTAGASRFLADWIEAMQADLRAGRNTSDDEKLRVLASSILSAAARGGGSYVKIHQLQQDKFPSWCGGKCGCFAGQPLNATAFPASEPGREILAPRGPAEGMLQCPAEAKPQEWMAYTFPCSRSEQELLALMDIYEAFLAHLDTAQASAAARQGTQPSESRAVVTRASRHHRHHSRRYTAPKEGMWDSGGTIQAILDLLADPRKGPALAGDPDQIWILGHAGGVSSQ